MKPGGRGSARLERLGRRGIDVSAGWGYEEVEEEKDAYSANALERGG